MTKAIWDAKGNRAIGKSKEAKEVNFALDNIKAQIAKHYQRLSDREAFVTAEMVRNAYQGIGTEYETLLRAFDKENLLHTSETYRHGGTLQRQDTEKSVCHVPR